MSKTDRLDQDQIGGPLALVLPCSAEDFGEFLSGLLGEPQIIEDEVFGNFVVERDDIINLFQLLEHRVREQDRGGLVSMSLTVTYDDKSSVRFSSLKDFDAYAEIKSHISTGFNLNLSYLLHFQNRSIPEKQEIDISFIDMHSQYTYDIRPARFKLRIRHTARSWGVAVEALIIGYINTIRKVPNTRFRRLVGRFNVQIGFFIAFSVFAASSIGLIWQLHRIGLNRSMDAFEKLKAVGVAQRQEEANQLILREIFQGAQDAKTLTFLCFVIFFIAFSISIGAAAGDFLSIKDRGYFVLTREASNAYESRMAAHKFFWFTLVIGSLISIVTGVISNALFAWISRL